jgi:dipeptidyl-peptidase 4
MDTNTIRTRADRVGSTRRYRARMALPSRCALVLLPLALFGRSASAGDAPAAPASKPQFPLERVIDGPPFHADLPDWSWRPGHAELVRTRTREKRRELVGLDPVSGVERVLLDLTALGEHVPGEHGSGERRIGRSGPAELVWSGDGDVVCALVKGERVFADLAGGRSWRLTQGRTQRSDVQLSPDGRQLSFEAGNDLWVQPVEGFRRPLVVASTHPEVLNGTPDWVYPEELDVQHGSWWAPDSSRLAFLRLDQRGVRRHTVVGGLDAAGPTFPYPRAGEKNPEASLWVIEASGEAEPVPVRLDLGTPAHEYVVRVAWTPDAARLLVVTLDRAQRRLRVRSQDPVTGAGTTLFEREDKAWIDPPPAPRFIAPREFVWRDDHDGVRRWWHVRLAADGASVVDGISEMTPDAFVSGELLHVERGNAPAGGALHEIVVAGQRPGERRAVVWRRAGAGAFLPWLPDVAQAVRADLSHDGRLALVRRSSALVPPVLEVRRVADGAVVRALGDAANDTFRALTLPRVEEGELAVDCGKVLWRLWLPRAASPGVRRPLVVTVYGGPGSRTVEDRFGGDLYWNALLVERGFAVLEADGRGTGGQGPAFERSVVGRLGVLELEDQVAAVKAVATHPEVDGSRVGVFGWSYGGTMAAHALARRSDVFKAGVAVAPVTDWALYDTIYTERYMGRPQDNAAGYRAASVIEHAGGLGGQLLLLHGLADDNVHPHNTMQLVEALLKKRKTTFAWQLYANRGHGLENAGTDVHRRTLEWLETHLK